MRAVIVPTGCSSNPAWCDLHIHNVCVKASGGEPKLLPRNNTKKGQTEQLQLEQKVSRRGCCKGSIGNGSRQQGQQQQQQQQQQLDGTSRCNSDRVDV